MGMGASILSARDIIKIINAFHIKRQGNTVFHHR